VAKQGPGETDLHQGNCYVLVIGLPRPEAPLTLAPGITLVPFESPLSVLDLRTDWPRTHGCRRRLKVVGPAPPAPEPVPVISSPFTCKLPVAPRAVRK